MATECFVPTNSLLSASFDILDMDGLTEPTVSLDALSKVNMDESYFCNSIKFIKKMNESFTDSKINLYKGMVLAESNTMLLEGFSDYYVQVDSIVSDALKFLRTKIDEFCEKMENFIKENTRINEHKKALLDELKTYQDDSRELHTFTIDNSIPNLKALDDFNGSLFEDLFKPQITDLNANDVRNTITATQLEEDFKRFRAHILNLDDNNISEQEFARALYLIFRNNQGVEEPSIDANDIKNMAEVWFGFNNIKKSLNDDYKTIEDSFNGILNKVSVISKNNNGLTIGAFTSLLPGDVGLEKIDGKEVDKSGMMMSSDMMLQLDVYCKGKTDQLHKYADIVIMGMTAKMDAIKDMYMEYRTCLYDAIEVLDNPHNYYDARK